MSGRQSFRHLVFLSLLGLFLSFRLRAIRCQHHRSLDVQAVAFSSAIEPAGANRCKVCHSANHCRNSPCPESSADGGGASLCLVPQILFISLLSPQTRCTSLSSDRSKRSGMRERPWAFNGPFLSLRIFLIYGIQTSFGGAVDGSLSAMSFPGGYSAGVSGVFGSGLIIVSTSSRC